MKTSTNGTDTTGACQRKESMPKTRVKQVDGPLDVEVHETCIKQSA